MKQPKNKTRIPSAKGTQADSTASPGKLILTWVPLLIGLGGLILGVLAHRGKVKEEEMARQTEAERAQQKLTEDQFAARMLSRDATMALGGPVIKFSAKVDPVNLEKADRKAEEALHRHKESPEAHTAKATIAKKLGNSRIARAYVDKALELDPAYPNALIIKGILDQEDGHLEEAKIAFSKAREEADRRGKPLEHDVATLNLANVFIKQGNTGAAEPLLDMAQRNDATLALVHNSRGVMHTNEGDLQKATAEFEKALSVDPQYAKALHNQRCALLAAGRVSEAKSIQEQLKALVISQEPCRPENVELESAGAKTGFWVIDESY